MGWLSEPPMTALDAGSVGGDRLLVSGAVLLRGWAVRESTAGAPARFTIRDQGSTAGNAIVPISLAADQSTRDLLPGSGLLFEQGVFLDTEAGAWTGSVFVTMLATSFTDRLPLVEGVIDWGALVEALTR